MSPCLTHNSLLCQELSAKINRSIEQQVAAAASSGKLTIMKNVAMEGYVQSWAPPALRLIRSAGSGLTPPCCACNSVSDKDKEKTKTKAKEKAS